MCVFHPAAVHLVDLCRDDWGCGSCWLPESAAHNVAFHGSDIAGRLLAAVDREMDVLSVNFGCLGDPRRHPISEEKTSQPVFGPSNAAVLPSLIRCSVLYTLIIHSPCKHLCSLESGVVDLEALN